MGYDHAQRNDADYYDGYGDDDGDHRTYHHDCHCADPNDFDPRPYLLTSRRFPEGQLVRRYYSLPDTTCQVVELLPACPDDPITAYALPSELQPA